MDGTRATEPPAAPEPLEVPDTEQPGEPSPAARSAGQRDPVEHALAATLASLVAALWLIFSPFVLDFSTGDAPWNPILVGAIIALAAAVRVGGFLAVPQLTLVNLVAGVWLFASSFFLGDSPAAEWNARVLGAIVFFLGLVGGASSEAARRGGPRRSGLG